MSNSKPPSSLREMKLISMNSTKRVYKKIDSVLLHLMTQASSTFTRRVDWETHA